jgi:hypothetical protein
MIERADYVIDIGPKPENTVKSSVRNTRNPETPYYYSDYEWRDENEVPAKK